MKRKAYTLAETLITLGIIGVIAALTIPSLTTSYRKDVYAKTLSAAVSGFENSVSAMIISEDVDNLLDTNAWWGLVSNGKYNLKQNSSSDIIDDFRSELSRFIPIEKSYVKKVDYDNLGSSNSSENLVYDDTIRFKTKKGYEYLIYINNVSKDDAKNELTALSQGYNYLNKAADVCIDINGEEKPNIVGRDLFCYELSVDGKLYPVGSREQYLYNNKNYARINSKTKCVTNKDGAFCADYLMKNGYKMDY